MLAFATQASKSLQQSFKSLEPIFTMLSQLRGTGAAYSTGSLHRHSASSTATWKQLMATFGRERTVRGGNLCHSGALLPAPASHNKVIGAIISCTCLLLAYDLPARCCESSHASRVVGLYVCGGGTGPSAVGCTHQRPRSSSGAGLTCAALAQPCAVGTLCARPRPRRLFGCAQPHKR